MTLSLLLAVATVFHASPEPGALGRVQQQVRTFLMSSPEKAKADGVEVVLGDGVYRLETPLGFAPADSGTPERPVVWRAAHRGRAILSGAVPVGFPWGTVRRAKLG